MAAEQLGLFDAPRKPTRRAARPAKRRAPLAERFAEFHAANPDVFAELRDMALQRRRAGRRHLSIALLFEVLRDTRALATVGSEFYLDNSFRADYSRLLAAEPELAGCFEQRTLLRKVKP